MSGRGDVGAQSKAGGWVSGLWQDVDDLLYILNIQLLAIAQVLEVDVCETAGILQAP